jgi:hypothetical protein
VIKDTQERWIKAFAPWGSPCAVVLKDGKIIKAQSGFGKIAESDFQFIKLHDHPASKIALL